jgi:TonB family protein
MIRSSRLIIATVVVTCFLLLLVAPSAVADDSGDKTDPPKKVRHIIDTSTDRTPARTAFPKYPRIARRDRIEGEATVCFRIDERGRIRSARIKSASNAIFKRPAMRAIRESSFEPLAPNEVLDRGKTCRTYRFRLEPVLLANQ